MRLLPEIRNLIGNYHVKSGVYHYYRDEYTQAVGFLRKALRNQAKLTASDMRKARHYLTLALMDSAALQIEKGDAERAVSELRAASEVSPNFPDIHFRLGRLLEQREERNEAVEEYTAALQCSANYLEAQVALGFCLIDLARHDEARTAFERALEIRLRKIQGPFSAGLAALEQGDEQSARDQFHQVFMATRRLAVEQMKAAQKLLLAGDFEGALEGFDRAAASNPRYPDVHNYRGIALCEMDRIEEAIAAFALSAALSPEYLGPLLNLAFAHLRAGDSQEAEAVLLAVLEVDPTETAARAKLEELRSVRVSETRRAATRGTVR